VSVGNLRVGGSGKTPTVEYIARLLVEHGHRPAILSRGYGRRRAIAGVTVVSDGAGTLASLDTAGDEPLMLARALPAVPVLVCRDRYRAGVKAEQRFGATVHILDDGFQHVRLMRDADLLLVSEDDLADDVLPAGALREPLANAVRADAILVSAGYAAAAERVGRMLGVATAFLLSRRIAPPRLVASGETVVVPTNDPVFALAAIARPDRFFADLSGAGWRLVGQAVYRDHHRFDQRDVARIAEQAKAARAAIILTTEKDAVRLQVCDLAGLPIAAVPMTVDIEPADAFARWLLRRIA